MKKLIAAVAAAVILVIVAAIFGYSHFVKIEPDIEKEPTAEINSEVTVQDYVGDIKNGELIDGESKIDTSKLGDVKVKFSAKNRFREQEFDFTLKVVDTTEPEIKYESEVTVTEGDDADLLEGVSVTDNSGESITAQVEGEYDLDKEGEYALKYVAEDSSGNKASCEFTLVVKAKSKSPEKQVKSNGKPYYIEVNRKQNVVMVYGLENGEYTKLVKTFICSVGTSTPTGTYKISDKYRWRYLYGDVWGQYATRITGSILFHSVPYQKKDKSTLEYWEFNKLGTKASLGCVRLMVSDTKWIYDNCPKGTKVTIYDSDELKVSKPSAPTIDSSSPNRGWDPTDPDPNNPW